MPPRLNLLSSRTSLSLLRSTSSSAPRTCDAAIRACKSSSLHGYGVPAFAGINSSLSSSGRLSQRRMNSTGSGKSTEGETAPEQKPENEATGSPDMLPHVSEEAAETARILGKRTGDDVGGPELQQGTPVEEMLKRDKDAAKYAPKVMQQEMNLPKGTRSFSTSATLRQNDMQQSAEVSEDDPSIAAVARMMAGATPPEVEKENIGFKFEPPARLPRTENLKHRYDGVVEQLTKLIMRDGKLALAQKHMEDILDHLRTASPPQIDPARPLLPGPPPAQLALNPILYLTLIVDSVAPLLKIRQQKGAAGGGASLPIPTPLGLRQRRRTALRWIIDSSEKRRDNHVAQRVANELVAVAEGRSSVWGLRAQLHRQAVSSRANVNWGSKGRCNQQCVQSESRTCSSNRPRTSCSSSHHNSGLSEDPQSQRQISLSSLGYLELPDSSSTSPTCQLSSLSSLPSYQPDIPPLIDNPAFFPQQSTAESNSLDPVSPWPDWLDFDIDLSNSDNSVFAESTQPDPFNYTNSISFPSTCDTTYPTIGDFDLDSMLLGAQGTDLLQKTQQSKLLPLPENSSSASGHHQPTFGLDNTHSIPTESPASTSLSASYCFDQNVGSDRNYTSPQNPIEQADASTTTPSSVDQTAPAGKNKRKQSPTDSASDAAAEKRRRNTLAARRFRQKQHDRVAELEQALETVSKERDALKMQVARWEGETMALRGMISDSKKKD